MKRLAVLLSGRGSNFKAIYKAIQDGNITNAEIAIVISNKADAKGLLFARDVGLDARFIDPASFSSREDFDKHVVNILNSKQIDLVCLAGFMRLITSYFINAYKDKIINIHPSLLPSFPGLNAQKQALEYGVKITGCTVHFVDEKVDHGPIILQRAVPVFDDDDVESLSERILKEEHKIYPEAINLIVNDKVEIKGRRVIVKKS
ncbi:phosphoribosylglycinamide formyltransferase [Deferribacter desulfuricans SSM1]|uniref:Phosphoribosylglycinamide formyltransferase n=1 Tax=Deferribacter desulfuricans (strain DSM 14783 / JCM 11476 / NBRC 101012 / SSM1) TaxID=639282 RepID=D3PAQ7_DEFDS|nr:phosphoribosylglycinamide formyltransferase [Deferribacter desulfuricans]BAI79680.1 phosphoribosylglycinamide formyltransferase [Deferribacter desulfuricans SSM1]